MSEKKKIVVSYDEYIDPETAGSWLGNAKIEQAPKGIKVKIEIVKNKEGLNCTE